MTIVEVFCHGRDIYFFESLYCKSNCLETLRIIRKSFFLEELLGHSIVLKNNGDEPKSVLPGKFTDIKQSILLHTFMD